MMSLEELERGKITVIEAAKRQLTTRRKMSIQRRIKLNFDQVEPFHCVS